MTLFNTKQYPFVIVILFVTILFFTPIEELFSKEEKGNGYNIREVLQPDKILAIKHPEFVPGPKARIHPDEPVIGLSINGVNRATLFIY